MLVNVIHGHRGAWEKERWFTAWFQPACLLRSAPKLTLPSRNGSAPLDQRLAMLHGVTPPEAVCTCSAPLLGGSVQEP